MITFIKAQVASFVASTVDYCCTIMGVELFGVWYVWASGIGTVAGGFTNFSLSRRWVFNSREDAAQAQLIRYGMVWSGYLLLTTLGVYLCTHYLQVNYILSKLAVTTFMAIFYNYPLQKRFVFG